MTESDGGVSVCRFATMRCFDTKSATPHAVRAELIRAVRDLPTSEPTFERVPDIAPRSMFRAVADCFQELELALKAVSESLADGIEFTVGRRDAA